MSTPFAVVIAFFVSAYGIDQHEGFAYVGLGICCAEQNCSGETYSSDGPTLTTDNGAQCHCGNRTIFDICEEMPDCLGVTIVGNLSSFYDCQLQLVANARCETLCKPGSYPICQNQIPHSACGTWYGACNAKVPQASDYNFSTGYDSLAYSQSQCYRKVGHQSGTNLGGSLDVAKQQQLRGENRRLEDCQCDPTYPYCYELTGWCYKSANDWEYGTHCKGTCTASFTSGGGSADPSGSCSGSPRYVVVRYPDRENVIYGHAFDALGGKDVSLKLDVYRPKFTLSGASPVIIALPGSGATKDDSNYKTWFFPNLASYGFTVVGVNYRNYWWEVLLGRAPSISWKNQQVIDAVTDLHSAVSWVKSNADDLRVDPAKLILVGYSAGAMTIADFVFNRGQLQMPQMDPGSVAACVMVSGSLYPYATFEHASRDQYQGSRKLPPTYWTYYQPETMAGIDMSGTIRSESSMKLFEDMGGEALGARLQGSGHVGYWPASQSSEMNSMANWLKSKLSLC